MTDPCATSQLTNILDAVDRGEEAASDRLLPAVYDELRRLARAKLAAEPAIRTLQPTGLVHEAYLRIAGEAPDGWGGRAHFFGAAARAMRRILVEQARARARLKRGGGKQRVDIDVDAFAFEEPRDDVLRVDDALRRLEARDARKSAIVNMRYFAGMSNDETAAALGVSVGTVEREWRFIRTWLKRELSEPADA